MAVIEYVVPARGLNQKLLFLARDALGSLDLRNQRIGLCRIQHVREIRPFADRFVLRDFDFHGIGIVSGKRRIFKIKAEIIAVKVEAFELLIQLFDVPARLFASLVGQQAVFALLGFGQAFIDHDAGFPIAELQERLEPRMAGEDDAVFVDFDGVEVAGLANALHDVLDSRVVDPGVVFVGDEPFDRPDLVSLFHGVHLLFG